jgi:hypothetical protein
MTIYGRISLRISLYSLNGWEQQANCLNQF